MTKKQQNRTTNMFYLMLYSFFLGELEKCLEDPERLALLFIKQVRNFSFTLLHLFCFNCRPSCFFSFSSFFSRNNYFILWAVIWYLIACSCLLPTPGAEAAHVHCVLPEQTQVWAHCFRVHRHLLWGQFWFPNSLKVVIPQHTVTDIT